jgi:hypothetical protein
MSNDDPNRVSPFGRGTITSQRLEANGADSLFKSSHSQLLSSTLVIVSNETAECR